MAKLKELNIELISKLFKSLFSSKAKTGRSRADGRLNIASSMKAINLNPS